MERNTPQRGFVVMLGAPVWFNTTVAVFADSKEEAAEKALEGAHLEPSEWLYLNMFFEDPIVTMVDEEDLMELAQADQKHLLPVTEGKNGTPNG